jgi:hypothetical protein
MKGRVPEEDGRIEALSLKAADGRPQPDPTRITLRQIKNLYIGHK